MIFVNVVQSLRTLSVRNCLILLKPSLQVAPIQVRAKSGPWAAAKNPNDKRTLSACTSGSRLESSS